MCGICGFTGATETDAPTLKAMCDIMAHRGPDGEGQYLADGVALGHRRLSLIDLENGSQPMVRATGAHDSIVTSPATEGSAPGSFTIGDYAIVFNGEIYNYRDLRDELAADGWIFFMGSPITDRTILHQPYPLVIVGDYDTQGLADWVTMPNVEAVRTAVGALLDSGCRRIALIGGTAENACPDADRESRPETTSTMRTRGYVLAHEERGLQVDWRLVRNADWVQSGGRDAVAGLLDDPDAPRPDAVMCLNDALAIGVIHELQRRGVRVPQDMQVIGFDNVPDAEYCMPGLTTIDPHVDDYARHAVDMLIARIEGSADPFRTYVTSYDLVRRASTC